MLKVIMEKYFFKGDSSLSSNPSLVEVSVFLVLWKSNNI